MNKEEEERDRDAPTSVCHDEDQKKVVAQERVTHPCMEDWKNRTLVLI